MTLRSLVWIVFLAASLFAERTPVAKAVIKAEKSQKKVSKSDNNATEEKKKSVSPNDKYIIEQLLLRINKLDDELKMNNIWSKIYSNYHTYLFLKQKKDLLNAKISLLNKKKKMTKEEEKKLQQYQKEKKTIKGKLQLLKEYEDDPFEKLLKPEPIGEVPSVDNPLTVISAISFEKKLLSQQEEYKARYVSLKAIVEKLKEEEKILEELIKRDSSNIHYKLKLSNIKERLKTYSPVLDIFETTQNVYTKKIDEIKLNLGTDIKRELEKTATIGGVILFFLLLFLLGKYLAKRYMSDNERYYTINKILNITFITLLVFILLFSYIENVSYLVTVLGFASAGIAIALKDWFMSITGWFVILIGGTIHVGDRVKFVRNGVEYVGDIVDISILRMTLHEDVTLTTYTTNRRTGRMIFIPNNYVFTDMIANYSHAGLKTVWDGIDFVITFDSNINKATAIAKEVCKKYSKGYTDITRKQLNKLRSSYSIRNTNVEPRILSFIEPYGMKISSWYLTNAFATLTLRSTISHEIIERIQAEDDISLAFPTQSVYLDKDVRKPQSLPEDEENPEVRD